MIAPTEPAIVSPPDVENDVTDIFLPGGPEVMPDPALLAASVMLASALTATRLDKSDVIMPGAIILLVVPDAEWVEPVRQAWTTDVSGPESVGDGDRDDTYYHRPSTLLFSAREEPKAATRRDGDECFAKAVARRARVVGICSNADFLPLDLVTAADHCLTLTELSIEDVAELAHRVTSVSPTICLTVTDAAAVTPRLARLAARPRQTGNDYLRKLIRLQDEDRARANRSTARKAARNDLRDNLTLDRLYGMDEAVAWGFQLRDDLAAYRSGQRGWADVDRGLLLSGPPGTGKTVYAQALAATCGVKLITGSYGSWLATGSNHQGDLLKAMRQAFRNAKDSAPAILFLDEVDSFSDRQKVKHFPEWHTEVVNTLLAEIDGVESREGVVVIGACNHPHKLDPALIRSGRLDRHIVIHPPGPAAIAQILRVHLGAELPHQDMTRLGLLLLGATGADVERLVRGGRRRARNAGRMMREADIIAEAGDQDRRGLHDLRVAAIHEAGHAVAAFILGLHVEGITIRSGGADGGRVRTAFSSNLMTAHDVHNQIVMLLSGRAAEEVVLGRITEGAGGPSGSDLQRATSLAASAAAELGLDADHGLTWTPLPHREEELPAMLAADARLAALVRRRLSAAYNDAVALARQSEAALRSVADALLDRGALNGEDVRQIVGALYKRR